MFMDSYFFFFCIMDVNGINKVYYRVVTTVVYSVTRVKLVERRVVMRSGKCTSAPESSSGQRSSGFVLLSMLSSLILLQQRY